MPYRVELTPRAVADADQAVQYLQQFDPEVAGRWLDGLTKAVLSLSEMPRRCPLAPEAERLGAELHQLLYGKRQNRFRIVFRIYDEAEPIVRVVAIRHGARSEMRPGEVEDESAP